MNAAPHQAPVLTTLVIYIFIAAFIVFRYSRPMKMSLTRLFVAPVLFVALTVFAIGAGQQTFPAPHSAATSGQHHR